MSRISVLDRNLQVDVQHNMINSTINKYGKDISVKGRTTVMIREDGTLIGIGHAFCSQFDQYTKKQGFVIALQRAMLDAKLNKNYRTVIWNYYGRKGKKTKTNQKQGVAMK